MASIKSLESLIAEQLAPLVAQEVVRQLTVLLDHLVAGRPSSATPTGSEAPWLSLKEASRRYGLGKTTLYELIAEERIVTAKVGNRRLIKATSIEEYLTTSAAPSRGVAGHER